MCGGFIGQVVGGVAKGLGLVSEPAQQNAPANAPANAPDAQAVADTSAAQGANAKLASRNRRRSASLLATGAGDTGLAQAPTASKSVLGA